MYFLRIISLFFGVIGFRGIDIVAKILVFIFFDIFQIRKSIVLQNLDLVFGEQKTKAEKMRIARRSFLNFIVTIFELLGSERLYPRAKVSFVHPEFMQEVLSRKEGMYALCIHMGNWEFLSAVNAKIYGPVHVVVKQLMKGKMWKWVTELRRRAGHIVVERDGQFSATKQIIKLINEKQIVGVIVDQKRPRGENLPFFNKIASTNNSLIRLYFAKPAPILPAIIKRIQPGEYEVTYFPEFKIIRDNSKTLAQQVTENTIRMNQIVEQMILANPEEYHWLHNRWNFKR